MFSSMKLSVNLVKNLQKLNFYNASVLPLLRIDNVNKFHTSFPLSSVLPQRKELISDDENQEFQSVYPQLINDIAQTASPDLRQRIEEMYDYNLRGELNVRGLFLVKAYKMMENPINLTEQNIKLANIMGWLADMSANVIFLSDDVIDQSLTRRGKPCWYTKEQIGLVSIYDVLLLENGVFHILKKYFKGLPYYGPALTLFHDVTLTTFMGQSLDFKTSDEIQDSIEFFTMDNFLTISRLKAGAAAFHLILALSMHMANITDPKLHEKSDKILTELGTYYQVHNDWQDCYGTLENTGKNGNEDIRCRRVTWFACTALEMANSNQKKLFAEHYGKKDDESIAIIRNLYDQLQLRELSQKWQEDKLAKIKEEIDQLPPQLNAHRFLIENLDELINLAHI